MQPIPTVKAKTPIQTRRLVVVVRVLRDLGSRAGNEVPDNNCNDDNQDEQPMGILEFVPESSVSSNDSHEA